ncbi:MAG: ABC transporter ATP-binding protein [Phycisphaeraceae bacterium]
MSQAPAVQTHELTKRYGEFTALDSLSITVERGQILGFIGPNGAGKTTTIKILVGLSRPTSGWAKIDGVDCTAQADKIKSMVGFMPDTFGAYENMRVHEYLDFFGAAFKIPRKQRRKRIDEVMDTAGCTYMRDLYTESLSHGMKQRVGIARTLLHDPRLLILDEPANGLDPNARIEMREILLKLADMGKTLIVTSHILPELSRICSVVAMITTGKLRAFGTLDDIMKNLNQRRKIEVELLNAKQTDQAAMLVESRVGEGAEMSVSEVESIIRFSTERDDKHLADLLGAMNEAGVSVVQFREVPLDLEDAFVSVTKATSEQTEPVAAG